VSFKAFMQHCVLICEYFFQTKLHSDVSWSRQYLALSFCRSRGLFIEIYCFWEKNSTSFYFYRTEVKLGLLIDYCHHTTCFAGGAFVIPYIIVLLLVGKPVYFMEMVLGQFSSRGSVKVFDCVPAMRGVGVGQVVSIAIVATYYSSIMALTLNYLADSFNAILPWSSCKEVWGDCIPSLTQENTTMIWNNDTKSSAELYFL
jgi:Sodium:neurotransmitter symporter family